MLSPPPYTNGENAALEIAMVKYCDLIIECHYHRCGSNCARSTDQIVHIALDDRVYKAALDDQIVYKAALDDQIVYKAALDQRVYKALDQCTKL